MVAPTELNLLHYNFTQTPSCKPVFQLHHDNFVTTYLTLHD